MQDGDTAVQEKSRKKLLLSLRDSNIYLDYEVQLDIILFSILKALPEDPRFTIFASLNMDFITENILLIITFVGSAILLAFPSLSKSKNSGLSPAEVVIQVNDKDAQLVDVRTPNEYSKGSLAGAVNIPAADLVSRIDTLDKNRPVILVTQNGRRAQQELKQFKSKGFSDVYVLEGGLVAWQAAKLPLTGLEINRRSNKKKKA